MAYGAGSDPSSPDTAMFIAIIDFLVEARDRDRAIARLEAEAPRIRSMPGNVHFRAFPDRDDRTALTVLHEWEDRESFEGYLASASFAAFNQELRPLMRAQPVSRRFLATPVDAAA